MFLYFVVAVFAGIAFGCATGLFPGIHINLVAAGLLASLGFLSGVEGIVLVVFIVAMAVTHTFLDFIPSVFLGAPEEDSFLSVLPGHELLLKGRGFEAVVLTLYGSLFSLGIVLVFSLIFVLVLPLVYELFRSFIVFVLIFVSFYLVFREFDFVLAGVVFLMSGFLGLLAFNLPVREPLLPLLTGLFGVSGLIVSLKNRTEVPEQKVVSWRKIRLPRVDYLKGCLAAALSAPLCSFLPGIGSGHAAVIGSEFFGSDDRKRFLFLVGAINTIVMALSFVTIFSIGRTRTGAAVAVSEILGEISYSDLGLIVFVVFVSGVVSFFLGIYLARFFACRIGKTNYSRISFIVLGILFFVNFFLSNFFGLLVLFVASCVGIFCILSGVRRIQLMGALLVPTVLFYIL